MSFTTEVKNEICSIIDSPVSNKCLLSGFIRNNGENSFLKISLFHENPKIIRFIFSLIKDIYEVNPEIIKVKGNNFNNKSLYNLVVLEKASFILEDLMVYDKDGNFLPELPEYFIDSIDYMRSYLRGAFLATGSVNDPKKSRYHLEFLVENLSEANLIAHLLENFFINAKVISREKGYMTYVKEAEKIGDFLRLIGVSSAVLYYEDIRIYRDHKNMTNRLNNCEQANIDKVIDASSKQMADIDLLIDKIGLELIDAKLRDVIIYRKKYPDLSLLELSSVISMETGLNISKSGLNHRFRKIHEMAEKLRNIKE